MEIRFVLSSIALSGILLAGCGEEKKNGEIMEISVDLSQCKNLDLDPENLILLETNDSSLIYDVGSLEKIGDRLYIYSGDFIRSFDASSGKYCGDISKHGEGPGEYTFISRFWAQGDTLHVWDSNLRKVFDYLPDGSFLGDRTPFHNGDCVKSIPSFFLESPAGGYYTINTYKGGTEPENPRYSFYDSNFNFVADLPGREMSDGSFIPDRGFSDRENNRVLVWEALKDTVFSLHPDRVEPVYAFNFGKNAFPADKQAIPDYYDRKDAYLAGEKGAWASMMRCFQVSGNYLYFSFVTNGFENYLGRVDLRNNRAETYRISDPEKKWNQQSFIKLINDSVYIAFSDTTNVERNPALYKLSL